MEKPTAPPQEAIDQARREGAHGAAKMAGVAAQATDTALRSVVDANAAAVCGITDRYATRVIELNGQVEQLRQALGRSDARADAAEAKVAELQSALEEIGEIKQ